MWLFLVLLSLFGCLLLGWFCFCWLAVDTVDFWKMFVVFVVAVGVVVAVLAIVLLIVVAIALLLLLLVLL